MAIPKKRLQKEYEKMIAENLSDFSVEIVEPHRWLVTFEMPAASVYPGETHRLEFTFCDNYPIESPQVKFLLPSPEHSHVYSNGHICLNILYDEWYDTWHASPLVSVDSRSLHLCVMLAFSD
mmetsp:Transcript_28865/g.48718  ORF Transcript_28865/g.48718 Transcript_28865/m.48718 type:complete len:122 (+) Transcript_28865:384-749(+)